jgi:hypothetical protein
MGNRKPKEVNEQGPSVIFQKISISALLVSIDYRAKRLDVDALRRGELWELVNLLPLLEGLEVAFRSATISDVVGLAQACNQLVSSWSADLNRTQILRSLTGVTPIRSFANIGGGFANMVLEPLKQYRAGKDSQQVSNAMLRGLVSFLKHVTVESIDLTERIFVGTQSALEYVNTCFSETQASAGNSATSRTVMLLKDPWHYRNNGHLWNGEQATFCNQAMPAKDCSRHAQTSRAACGTPARLLWEGHCLSFSAVLQEKRSCSPSSAVSQFVF